MLSSSDSTSPLGDSPDRSSTGIRGPYPSPGDDDELEIDVADATIVDLEDGFSFFRTMPTKMEDLAGRYEATVDDPSDLTTRTTTLERNWLVEHGES
jgi:hypothetical protein